MEVKIIIVDDHHLARTGIRSLLSKDKKKYHVIGEAGSSDELFSLLKNESIPDLILLDIILPRISGIEIAKRLREEYPEILILILSSESDYKTISKLVEIGIEGFILKSAPQNELFHAIDSIMEGIEYYGRDIARLIHDIKIGRRHPDQIDFTEKELVITELCAQGLTVKEIATELQISRRTIETHKANILRKLGLNNAVELVCYAIRNGYIQV